MAIQMNVTSYDNQKLELRRLRAQYAHLKRTNQLLGNSIHQSIREIQLRKLFATVQKIFGRKLQTSKQKPKTEQEIYFARLKYGREKGNEYAEQVRQQLIEKGFGYQQGEEVQLVGSVNTKALTYGNYYSARNRLQQMDLVGKYDKNFQSLLLKCAAFEKDHPDVRGFLDQTILHGTGYEVAKEESSKLESNEEKLSKVGSTGMRSSQHKDIEIYLETSNSDRSSDMIIWSQVDTYMEKVSEVDSELEVDKVDSHFNTERIGDQ